MAISGTNLADAVFNGLRASIGACQGYVRLNGTTSIDAIVQAYTGDREQTVIGLDTGITGSAYIRFSAFTLIPTNQKIEVDIGDGKGFQWRRVVNHAIKAQAVVRIDYGDLYDGE
jgi:hypothetical protein